MPEQRDPLLEPVHDGSPQESYPEAFRQNNALPDPEQQRQYAEHLARVAEMEAKGELTPDPSWKYPDSLAEQGKE